MMLQSWVKIEAQIPFSYLRRYQSWASTLGCLSLFWRRLFGTNWQSMPAPPGTLELLITKIFQHNIFIRQILLINPRSVSLDTLYSQDRSIDWNSWRTGVRWVGGGGYKVLWESNIASVTKIVERRISETAGNQVSGGEGNTFGNFSTLGGRERK